MIVVHKDTDITEYVSSMSWGGSRSEVARKLELHIVNAPLDKNITPLTINLADPVYLFEDDGKTELFRGFVQLLIPVMIFFSIPSRVTPLIILALRQRRR